MLSYSQNEYHNIAIKISGNNGYERAKIIAKKYGYTKVVKIGDLEGYYSLENRGHARIRRSAPSHRNVDVGGSKGKRIKTTDNSGKLERNKADHETLAPKKELVDIVENDIEWMETQVPKMRVKRDLVEPKFNDPMYPRQWYLDNKDNRKLDINVVPVWSSGLTGSGIVVTILDDGIESNHSDLVSNYDPQASWDINDDDPDPFPRYDRTDENKHGTRCAGEVAAMANNRICGIGVAYNSKIGGVRMLDGHVTDKVEAASLSLNPQYIDIYSSSWGPNDDGKTVEGPGTLAKAAFINGITKGRGGLGSIYAWASGFKSNIPLPSIKSKI